MTRLGKFTRSLFSGYLLLGANVLYTLASVPLALHYLSRAEFGLWALTLQVATYLALVDLGMAGSVARILIDHKDRREDGHYGGVIQSGFLVGLAQGAIALVVGLCLVWFLGVWIKVPSDLSRQFFWLMIGQILLTVVTFMTRIVSQILFAWQRMDISNYATMAQFIVGFAVLWIGFVLEWGVFSLLAGAVAGWICNTAICFLACYKLGLWPQGREWGRASPERFRELFSYGADMFLMSIGAQLIMSSQTVLVSRQLGVEAAALWSVMNKAFSVLSQVVFRVIGNAMPAFAEMHVRKENDLLWKRYRAMFITVSVLSGVCGVLFAACNGLFVSVWMHGRFSWPAINNILLAAWLVVEIEQCCHSSLIMFLKEIRGLKYIYLIEGVVFVVAATVLLPSTGMTGMLICSLVATILFTWLAATWRVAGLMGSLRKQLFWDWQLPLFWVVGLMVPCWLVIEWILRDAPDRLRLVASGSLLGAVGVYVSIRIALPYSLTSELLNKLPESMKRPAWIITRLICGKSSR